MWIHKITEAISYYRQGEIFMYVTYLSHSIMTLVVCPDARLRSNHQLISCLLEGGVDILVANCLLIKASEPSLARPIYRRYDFSSDDTL